MCIQGDDTGNFYKDATEAFSTLERIPSNEGVEQKLSRIALYGILNLGVVIDDPISVFDLTSLPMDFGAGLKNLNTEMRSGSTKSPSRKDWFYPQYVRCGEMEFISFNAQSNARCLNLLTVTWFTCCLDISLSWKLVLFATMWTRWQEGKLYFNVYYPWCRCLYVRCR